MSDDVILERLARLESLVEEQAETIEEQQETIEAQRERLSQLEARDNSSPRVVLDGGDIKVIGEVSADNATGVLGRASGSGFTCGVRGEASNGYGLYTPHDASVDGVAELASLGGEVTGNATITDLVGDGLTVDGGTLTGTYVQDSEPPVGNMGTFWARPTPLDTSDTTTLGSTVRSIAIGDDGSGTQFLYASDNDQIVHKIDPSVMSQEVTFTTSGSRVDTLEYGAGGFLYAGDINSTVYKIDPSGMSQVETFTTSGTFVRSLAYGAGGFLYAGDNNTTLYKIDPGNLSQVDTFTTSGDSVDALAYGADGFLYAGDNDQTVYKIDPDSMSQVDTFTVSFSSSFISSLAYGAGGFLYVGDPVSTIYKVDPSDMSQVDTFTISGGSVTSLADGSDGLLYVMGSEGTVFSIDPTTMSEDDRISGSGDAYSITDGNGLFVYAGVGATVLKISDGSSLFVSTGTEWLPIA